MVVQRAATLYAAKVRRDPVADLFTGSRLDPYDRYEQLRAAEAGDPLPKSSLGLRYTTNHAFTQQILTSRAFGAVPGHDRDGWFDGDIDLSLLQLNPPDHTRLRRIVTPAFGRGRMIRYENRIRETVDRLLDAVPADEPWDLMSRFSASLPIAVIVDLLGIEDYDEPTFLRYGAAIGGALDGVRSPRHAAEMIRTQQDLRRIFEELFARRAKDPREDVISGLVAARDEHRIAPEDMVGLCALLLLAGFETTVNLIGNAVLCLLRNPQQWQALVADPALAAGAVEETLRYLSPVQLTSRFALERTELGGVTFEPGEAVIPFLAAANRDPKVFERPLEFDITRPNAAEHLAFSGGAHYCLGAPLARLEGRIALQALVQRFPTLHIAGPTERRRGMTLYGAKHLVVSA